MTICPLFSGAELYYNDMHLAFFEEATAPMRNVIEINHCRVGRYECSFGENSCCYLAAGDFAVCAAARKKSSSCFPLRHYHGITILLDLDAISPEMRKQMEWYGVDLDVDTTGMPRQCLIDTVIYDFLPKMIRTGSVGVHAGATTHRFQTIEDFNGFSGISLSHGIP
jgi:hypothetical protein